MTAIRHTARRPRPCLCGCGRLVVRPETLRGRPPAYASRACSRRRWKALKREAAKRSVHFSSASGEWATPPELLAELAATYARGAFDLDPCCGGPETACAPRWYTPADDGLTSPWFGRVFVNPEYGRIIATWMARAEEAARSGEAEVVVCLVPARPGSRWYMRAKAAVAELGGVHLELPGRLRFRPFGSNPAVAEYEELRAQGKRMAGAAFPSAVFVFPGRRP